MSAARGPARVALRRRGVIIAAAAVVVRPVSAAGALGAIEEGQFAAIGPEHDFSRIAVLVGLVLPFAGLDLTLEIDLGAFLQKTLGDLDQVLVEDHHAMPLGPLFSLAGIPVLPGLGRRDRQVADLAAALHRADLRILAQITDENHLVDTAGHESPVVQKKTQGNRIGIGDRFGKRKRDLFSQKNYVPPLGSSTTSLWS